MSPRAEGEIGLARIGRAEGALDGGTNFGEGLEEGKGGGGGFRRGWRGAAWGHAACSRRWRGVEAGLGLVDGICHGAVDSAEISSAVFCCSRCSSNFWKRSSAVWQAQVSCIFHMLE